MEQKKASFKDTKGREWPFSINMFNARLIKTETGIDLLSLFTDDKTAEILDDENSLELLAVYFILSDAKNKGVNEEDFFTALDETAVLDAQRALMQALVNFSHARKGKVLNLLIEKAEKKQEKQWDLIETRAEAFDFGNLSTDLPESSE